MGKLRRLFFSVASALGLLGANGAHAGDAPGSPTMELRQRALDLKPSDIGISPASYPHSVWGLVMDTTFDDGGSYTFMALADGTTSIYFSNGGGIIGAGQHAQVRSASFELLAFADSYVSLFRQPANTTLPKPGLVTIYLLTFQGTRSYTANEQDLGYGRDKMSSLFLKVQGVIAAVRQQQQSNGAP